MEPLLEETDRGFVGRVVEEGLELQVPIRHGGAPYAFGTA
jgi:hypothetical protein